MSQRLFQIELPIDDSWQSIELLRTTIRNCLTTMFRSKDYCDTLAMVVGELLENALKYAQWNRRQLTPGAFRLRVGGTEREVEVRVTNPVAAGADLDRLFQLLRRIEQAPSPEHAYVELMREVASDASATGGLGLARIAYEANCRLEAELDADQVLEVRAVVNASPVGRVA